MHTPLPPAEPSPNSRSRRSNWGLRLVAALISALAFLGFWQGTQHTSIATATSSSQYAPPTSGGLLPPGGLVPHGSTHVS